MEVVIVVRNVILLSFVNKKLIIQFGNNTTNNGSKQITLPLSFSNTKYCTVGCIRKGSDPSGDIQSVCVAPHSNTQIVAYLDYFNSKPTTMPFSWICCGY